MGFVEKRNQKERASNGALFRETNKENCRFWGDFRCRLRTKLWVHFWGFVWGVVVVDPRNEPVGMKIPAVFLACVACDPFGGSRSP